MGTFGRLRRASNTSRELLTTDWEVCSAARADELPQDLRDERDWIPARAPSTVASTLRDAGRWSLDGPSQNFDAQDWWYRLRFTSMPAQTDESVRLCFGGLATVAKVWLNGISLLDSANMFQAHAIDVSAALQSQNELLICFRSLERQLTIKRPRPRWKAPMIPNQQLRWFRTTLLGRTPGWSPSAAAVGPWRDVWLERSQHIDVSRVQLLSTLLSDRGKVALTCNIAPLAPGVQVSDVRLSLTRGEAKYSTRLSHTGSHSYGGDLEVMNPDRWWPHTHGDPALYTATLLVTLHDTNGEHKYEADLGCIGFRTIAVDTNDGNFSIAVNGTKIFCRGACWTPPDVVSLNEDSDSLSRIINLVRSAGMNMLRVGGTMVYESDEFLDLCDANGILLWQELMFANMDYPETEEFLASVREETKSQLSRLSGRPCLAVLCGNSEGEQQAAMFGATRDRWSPALFHAFLPNIVRDILPDTMYWPSSAHGGAFPHQNNVGTTSYYGVGAYLRPLEDARRSEVKFATECLAFANIPELTCIEKMPNGSTLKVHHPAWKQRTPRDLGAGWDFEDVRDHYLKLLFDEEPAALRYADHDRYLQLGRVTTGEVTAASFNEWRRKQSTCNGALIWYLKDFVPGAGWGIIDAEGNPKSNYYYAKRALQPIVVSISDEGCNGVAIHLVNDAGTSFDGTLELSLFAVDGKLITKTQTHEQIAPHSAKGFPALQLFDYFSDHNHAYRFGPRNYDALVTTLCNNAGEIVSRAFYFPAGIGTSVSRAATLTPRIEISTDSEPQLIVHTDQLALGVTVELPGYECDDQYFNVPPGGSHRVRLSRSTSPTASRGIVRALNCSRAVDFELQK